MKRDPHEIKIQIIGIFFENFVEWI